MTTEHTPRTPYDERIGDPYLLPHTKRKMRANRDGYLRALEDAKPYREAVEALVLAAVKVEGFISGSAFANHDDMCDPDEGCDCYVSAIPDALDALRDVQ